MKTKIEEIDAQTSAENLTNKNLSIENIVCTFNLNQEFDLEILNNYLDYTEYEPESFPFLVYRPQKKQGTILIPTNGKVSLVGCKKKGGDPISDSSHRSIIANRSQGTTHSRSTNCSEYCREWRSQS